LAGQVENEIPITRLHSAQEYMTKILLSPNGGQEGTSFRIRKTPKAKNGKKGGGRYKQKREPAPNSLAEQPGAEMSTTIPCGVCGHPVDPKRMHAHMVRFHGIAFRSKSANGTQP
jgi:hypothetical protein